MGRPAVPAARGLEAGRGGAPRVWYPGCGTRVFLESFPGVLPERRRAAAAVAVDRGGGWRE